MKGSLRSSQKVHDAEVISFLVESELTATQAMKQSFPVLPWTKTALIVPGINSRFHHYVTISAVRHQIEQSVVGSTQKTISLQNISSLLIRIPLDLKQAIAHILGTLDDKIELNRRMNETLETVARALFKSWFVDFDPCHGQVRGPPTARVWTPTPPPFPDPFEDSQWGKTPKGWGREKLTNC